MAWRHYVCELKGRTASVLIDHRFENQFPVKELPRLVWVGVYHHTRSEDSALNPIDIEALEGIERELISLSQSFGHGWMVYILRIQTAGIREYYFYCSEHAEPNKIATALRALNPTYRIEVDETLDADWIEYKNYVSFEASSRHES